MDPTQASESFREVIEFVKCVYIELAQRKSQFNDYRCIFCTCAYFELLDLISHIEDFHRDQILQGTFNLEHNFEEFLRARILGPSLQKEEEHSSSPYEMYQCAKCQQTFVSVSDITEHLVICSREDVVTAQQHHPTSAATIVQAAQSPIVEQPINQNLYGCARCGYRFGMLRDLVVHLHSCTIDTFYNKNQFLLPHLYVEAPNNQHIVVNEAETNTTLNTPALWLMSNITGPCTEDSVMKGFWVMPPPNNHHLPLLGIQQAAAATAQTATILQQPVARVAPVNPLATVAPPPPVPQQQTVLVVQSPDNSGVLHLQKNKTAPPSSLYAMQTYIVDELPNSNTAAMTTSTVKQAIVIPSYVEKPKRKRATEVKSNGDVASSKRKRQLQPPQQQQQQQHQQSLPLQQHHIPVATASVISVPTPHQTLPNRAPPPQPLQQQQQQLPPQLQQGNFENYVITYDDNTTQIISPGDELYEHVVNSYKEQRNQDANQTNVVNMVASNCSPSPTLTELQPMSSSPPPLTHIRNVGGGNSRPATAAESHFVETLTEATPISKDALTSYPVDDLSHLDKPIHLPPAKISLTSQKDHYLASYCSFLETRQKNKV